MNAIQGVSLRAVISKQELVAFPQNSSSLE
jgi:hypothetical protein